MIRALKVYKEVGYEYMIMPDHVPGISGPEPGKVGFAYAFGYIHAALQAVEEYSGRRPSDFGMMSLARICDPVLLRYFPLFLDSR